MPRILHILTRPDDPQAREVIRCQKANPQHEIEIVDLMKPNPNYKDLLHKIFHSDSVESW
ncbi:MAG TPA: hypothetical protein VH619_05800 [Verrucomicrobiae bacterium]|jgi:hypothetical protein|nr:hypothetical protein [Verrucomicrobiae bacterium]